MTRQEEDEINQIKFKIQDHLISSGNYELINKQLKLQLYESGWYDKVAQITNKELSNGNDTSSKRPKSLNELYTSIKPKAEELVPDEVKENIIRKIEQYLDGILET
ncbi:uncharacterized protein LODBEIA_P31750 [Lodderomyces beijingensis]|uniref:Transcription and mRNA export factor SUS1 n=1 Tax=Lodderomyces beijingensis TaxID=1775926 RepID=A0ABP0ZLB6_9ASCO